MPIPSSSGDRVVLPDHPEVSPSIYSSISFICDVEDEPEEARRLAIDSAEWPDDGEAPPSFEELLWGQPTIPSVSVLNEDNLPSLEPSYDPCHGLREGMTFASVAEAKDLIPRAIIDGGQSFVVRRSDRRRRTIYGCKDVTCDFHINVRNIGKVTLTKIIPHTYPIATHFGFRHANSVKYLTPHHQEYVADNPNLPPRQIRSVEQAVARNRIPYMAAWRVRETLRQRLNGREAENFKKIPTLMSAMTTLTTGDGDTQSGAYTRSRWEEDGSYRRFSGAMVVPTASITAVPNALPILYIDAYYLTGRFGGVMMMGTMPDAERATLPANVLRRLHIISDRQKGLVAAVSAVLPDSQHSHCCKHIEQNVRARFGRQAAKTFWSLALKLYLWNSGRASKPSGHDLAIFLLIALKVSSRNSRTSGRCQSSRFFAIGGRKSPVYTIVDAVSSTLTNLPVSPPIGSSGATKQDGNIMPFSLRVLLSSTGRDQCDCGEPWDNGLPCRHIQTVCRELRHDPAMYVSDLYTVRRYKDIYRGILAPFAIDTATLEIGEGLLPPQLRPVSGRRRTKRLLPGVGGQRRCSRCGGLGHRRDTCTNDMYG